MSQLSPEAAFGAALGRVGVKRLGLAVSGGGDSMALMHLAAAWAAQSGAVLQVASVDHRLRPEAGGEVAMVARAAHALGLDHAILTWEQAPGNGNLQDAARRARYGLLADWARAHALEAVALGHTLDDQGETFLMRLARGSGVDGLAAMRADWHAHGMRWLRPLLGVGRQALRDWLGARKIEWVEDPSNEDARFARVRARGALEALAPLDIDAPRLAATAARLARARAALSHYAFEAARAHCRTQSGDVLVARAAFDLPDETVGRLIAHALCWVASAPYRPRYRALSGALAALAQGRRASLHGCLLSPEAESVRISREFQAVKQVESPPGALWDQRWRLRGGERGVVIRALGQKLDEVADWRQSGLPRASLMASPAVFRAARLVAAPLAGLSAGWSAELDPINGDFHQTLLLH